MANWIDVALVAGKFAYESYKESEKDKMTAKEIKAAAKMSGDVEISMYKPRSATEMKIDKAGITSQGEATVAKHRNILARALNQAAAITAKAKRT